MRIFPVLATAVLLTVTPSLALGAPAGNAVGVKQQAAAVAGETRTLVVGADLFIGDLVQTGARGQVQILFSDNTELVVGPNSALTIEDYLIRNDGSAGKLAVDVLSGAFRFATGDSAKNRYVITTPTGTIGVRGTELDGWVDPVAGISYIIRHGGIVDICTLDKSVCDVLDDICEVGKIASAEAEALGDSRESEGDLRALYKQLFEYTENQAPLMREFWFIKARDCLNAPPDVPPQPVGNSNSGKPPDKKITR
jgi:hypothetical protein